MGVKTIFQHMGKVSSAIRISYAVVIESRDERPDAASLHCPTVRLANELITLRGHRDTRCVRSGLKLHDRGILPVLNARTQLANLDSSLPQPPPACCRDNILTLTENVLDSIGRR